MTFIEMLRNRWSKVDSMVCVGLDSEYSQISDEVKCASIRDGWAENIQPVSIIYGFNRAIVSATKDLVCAFKPNMAFYEGEWTDGFQALQRTIGYIRGLAADIPIILDAKRTDIGNTNRGYAKMAFDELGADAITVNPYFGGEALKPFLDRADKGVIVLCRTSNPGAKEFQDLKIPLTDLPEKGRTAFLKLEDNFGGILVWIDRVRAVRLYQWVALQAATEWNKNGNVLLVAGATYPEELKIIRQIVGNMPILVPAIGAQAGDLEATVRDGLDDSGFGMIINSARGVIFASKGGDFAEAAGREAKKLRDSINEIKAKLLVKKVR